MRDSCFTIFCWFLLYNHVNQPHVYTCPLPLETPSHLPPHPAPQSCHRAMDLNSLHDTALEDSLEKGVATQSSVLAWRIPHGQRSLVGDGLWVAEE